MMRYTNSTVLIVDDTPANITLLFQLLQQKGYKVLVAESGERALVQLQYALPDLILLDVQMPGMSGFETSQHIKANPQTADIPIIFLTVLSEANDKIMGFQSGGIDYVVKPFNEIEVLMRVNTHLSLRHLQQQLKNQNSWLEEQVEIRTADLQQSNQALQQEIQQRQRHEEEKDKLFALVRQQSDHLRDMTEWLIAIQQQQQTDLLQTLHKQLGQNLRQADLQLDILHQQLTGTPHSQALYTIADIRQTINQTKACLQKITADLEKAPIPEEQLNTNPRLQLTTRETEVLQLIAEGKTSNEISALLNLSEVTIRTYRNRLMKKLNIHNLAGLVKLAIKHQLVKTG